MIGVQAEESRSGAKAKITIDPQNCKSLLVKIKIFFSIDLCSL